MRQVSEATKPDLVIFVMDSTHSSIGQAAFDQARAFKESVKVGACRSNRESPVIFIGTGEHMDEFKVFDVKPFEWVTGLGLGTNFMKPFMDQQTELLQKLSEGNFTLRIMYEQFQNTLKTGPLDQVFSMVPGFCAELKSKGQAYIKRWLDSSNPKFTSESRMMRIARGSGCLVKKGVGLINGKILY
ncbi:hypothetical protein K1719_018662 [Acacia pycnantha]|nr:hypothetical protein K1719_018662 [Acacia pycnantha]